MDYVGNFLYHSTHHFCAAYVTRPRSKTVFWLCTCGSQYQWKIKKSPPFRGHPLKDKSSCTRDSGCVRIGKSSHFMTSFQQHTARSSFPPFNLSPFDVFPLSRKVSSALVYTERFWRRKNRLKLLSLFRKVKVSESRRTLKSYIGSTAKFHEF